MVQQLLQILIGSLLGQAEELLKIGIPVAAITRGYEKSLDCALETLDEIEDRVNQKRQESNEKTVGYVS